MNDQPILTDAQWNLIADLLQRELEELPVEIHHTRNAEYREELHRRMKMVQELIEELRVPMAV